MKGLGATCALLLSSVALVTAVPTQHRRADDCSVPDFVVKHAPITFLHKDDKYKGGKIADFLKVTNILGQDRKPAEGPSPRTLSNINKYSDKTYLSAPDDVEKDPQWMLGVDNPDSTLIVVPKENNIVDAFWFMWYPYNFGPAVFGKRFGNHVGDWEHIMVRFENSKPTSVYYSAHDGGYAVTWNAARKIGDRPIGYVARGTHANYPNNGRDGKHAYTIPLGLLADYTTDEKSGVKPWDLNENRLSYCLKNDVFTPASTPNSPPLPIEWLSYAGRWGDQELVSSDPRQYNIFGQKHYVTGPQGPNFKNLMRKDVCGKSNGKCDVDDKNKNPTVWDEIFPKKNLLGNDTDPEFLNEGDDFSFP
ncbi:hypothetical protein DFS34DRAFT_326710 [Phlyctochytrium arcticum]|nr:hypothetical protein DFS34DRAFT_326710 [Phlyctochytrium arcticum]